MSNPLSTLPFSDWLLEQAARSRATAKWAEVKCRRAPEMVSRRGTLAPRSIAAAFLDDTEFSNVDEGRIVTSLVADELSGKDDEND
jgi:hypothetical protein